MNVCTNYGQVPVIAVNSDDTVIIRAPKNLLFVASEVCISRSQHKGQPVKNFHIVICGFCLIVTTSASGRREKISNGNPYNSTGLLPKTVTCNSDLNTFFLSLTVVKLLTT